MSSFEDQLTSVTATVYLLPQQCLCMHQKIGAKGKPNAQMLGVWRNVCHIWLGESFSRSLQFNRYNAAGLLQRHNHNYSTCSSLDVADSHMPNMSIMRTCIFQGFVSTLTCTAIKMSSECLMLSAVPSDKSISHSSLASRYLWESLGRWSLSQTTQLSRYIQLCQSPICIVWLSLPSSPSVQWYHVQMLT